MTTILFTIFPVAVSFLFLMVFKKAGFSGAVLALSFAPLAGALLSNGAIYLLQSGLLNMIPLGLEFDFQIPMFMVSSLLGQLLGILPVIVLAFVTWPAHSR